MGGNTRRFLQKPNLPPIFEIDEEIATQAYIDQPLDIEHLLNDPWFLAAPLSAARLRSKAAKHNNALGNGVAVMARQPYYCDGIASEVTASSNEKENKPPTNVRSSPSVLPEVCVQPTPATTIGGTSPSVLPEDDVLSISFVHGIGAENEPNAVVDSATNSTVTSEPFETVANSVLETKIPSQRNDSDNLRKNNVEPKSKRQSIEYKARKIFKRKYPVNRVSTISAKITSRSLLPPLSTDSLITKVIEGDGNCSPLKSILLQHFPHHTQARLRGEFLRISS